MWQESHGEIFFHCVPRYLLFFMIKMHIYLKEVQLKSMKGKKSEVSSLTHIIITFFMPKSSEERKDISYGNLEMEMLTSFLLSNVPQNSSHDIWFFNVIIQIIWDIEFALYSLTTRGVDKMRSNISPCTVLNKMNIVWTLSYIDKYRIIYKDVLQKYLETEYEINWPK